MVGIVDRFPYPFDQPPAQELVRVMAGLYRTEREALAATQPFGIDPLEISPNLSPINLWWEILGKLAILGTVRSVVQAAKEQFPNNTRAAFLAELLADRTAPCSAEPVRNGAPVFDDTVSQPEALLFFDDLTIPISEVPGLLGTLQIMIERAKSVCLLRIKGQFGSYFGTGFRIGPTLLLTNYHVLFPDGSPCANVEADFEFSNDLYHGAMQVRSFACDTTSIIGEKSDDWAIVRVTGLDESWPTLSLDVSIEPKPGDMAFIIQHPNAQKKRLGYVRNMITDVADDVIRYLTDTEPGSSGSPVFDYQGRIIAVHHAGGRPFEVAGRPPVAKNEGIRISRVLKRLRAREILL